MSNGSLNLYVDNVLVLANKDSVTVPLEEGNEYVVHWFVTGRAGSSYSITMSSPRESYQQTKMVGRTGKDLGHFSFII